MGCAVRAEAEGEIRGRVTALFGRSAHLRAGDVFITVGDETLCAHPYTVATAAFAPRLIVGQPFRMNRDALLVPGALEVPLDGLREFTPPAGVRPLASRRAIARALSDVRAAAADLPDRGGFHGLVTGRGARDGLAGRLLGHAREHTGRLRSALGRRDLALVGRAAHALAGEGEGLTPSGDDYLAGLLFALRFLGASGKELFPRSFLEELGASAAQRSSPFSGFLLSGASRGLVAEPVSAWLEAVLSPVPLSWGPPMRALHALGHSSGMDMLAGMLHALEAALEATPWPT